MSVAIATVAISVSFFAFFVLLGLIIRRGDRQRERESHARAPQAHD